jgi:benzoyl-CoA-dihydrodiol lyase
MAVGTNAVQPRVSFDTSPEKYRHWKLSFDGAVATLSMDVQEDAGLSPDYRLKLNSYDLGVDIELADAIERIRFEHPEVHAVVITSLKERIFCAGANIFMLRGSSHAWKVNFCKFTNETRLAMEDASAHSGLKFLAALNGICAGGGYELALACDEIVLVDDGNSAVSLPETPLLAVLPGTGGLTRVVDKRKVRRDLADVFGTVAEGVKGRRAVEWRLVDAVYPTSQFKDRVAKRAAELAVSSDRPSSGPGITLGPLRPTVTDDAVQYSSVSLQIDRAGRVATLTVKGPDASQPTTPDEILQAGDAFWPLRAFRELDAALLHLRIDEPLIGTVVVRTEGDPARVLAVDETLVAHADHWLVREIVHFMKRTLKRMDLTARSFFALIEPGSCFAGSLFELALAADRSYMLDDPERPNTIALSAMNGGPLKMSNGLTRLETRFLGMPERVSELLPEFLKAGEPFDPPAALDAGLVSFAPDELDWDDEVRLAIEARAALSPDALTGMEANLRFAGPETMETKIFGRLTAWQNWIFQRPNAVGEKGALTAYGSQARPEFDFNRT